MSTRLRLSFKRIELVLVFTAMLPRIIAHEFHKSKSRIKDYNSNESVGKIIAIKTSQRFKLRSFKKRSRRFSSNY